MARISALISTGDRDRVVSWIEEAVSQGAKVAAGGDVVTVAAEGGGGGYSEWMHCTGEIGFGNVDGGGGGPGPLPSFFVGNITTNGNQQLLTERFTGLIEDPALLEWDAPGVYRARLYPIGGGTREIMNEIISKAEGY